MSDDDLLATLKGGLEYVQKGWTTDFLARDAQDNPVGPTSSAAVKWCLEGAMEAAVSGGWGSGWNATSLCGEFVPEDFTDKYGSAPEDPVYRAIRFNNAQESPGPVEDIIKKAIEKREKDLVPA